MNQPEKLGFAPLTIYKVPKKCANCPAEWEGNSFRPAPADGSRVSGLCDSCSTRAEDERKKLTAPPTDTMEEIVIQRPRRVSDD